MELRQDLVGTIVTFRSDDDEMEYGEIIAVHPNGLFINDSNGAKWAFSAEEWDSQKAAFPVGKATRFLGFKRWVYGVK